MSNPPSQTANASLRRQFSLDEEALDTDTLSSTGDIHEILKELRRREVQTLTHDATNLRSAHAANHYFHRVILETGRYIRFVFWTWWGLFVTTIFGGLGPFDWFTMFVYAFGGTVVLFVVLVACLIVNSPPLINTYKRWSKAHAGGLGIVNSSNPKLFESLTREQADAGKEYLSKDWDPKKDTETARHFNLDAAKLLLQFAALVYEHPNQAVRNAVLVAAEAQGIESGLFTTDHVPKEDDLFKLSAEKSRKFIEALTKSDTNEQQGDGVIRKFCHRIGVEFEPVSELGNTSSAFTALFWDPKSNWIAVVFKGTSPIEFGEWMSDLNTKMSHVGSHIPGFRKVHLGFKDRVYPEDYTRLKGVRPYDTISRGVKALANWLRRNNGMPDKKINVWFTGHSLGCATASLVYARFLMREKDLGKTTSNLRDAYLFAAPILTDRDTVEVFNSKMLDNPEKPRTMWRITSNGDFVATCLPELGDYTSIVVSPNNAFAFAHLGTEIKLRDAPHPPHATGNHLIYGIDVHIETKFTKEQIAEQRNKHNKEGGQEEAQRQELGRLLQAIPLLGRIIAHGCVFYWDQLDRIATHTTAEWAWN